jgi:hypothetical protein
MGQGGSQKAQYKKIIVDSFGLDTVILADVSALLEVLTGYASTTKWTFQVPFLCILNLGTQ